ncbi:hypothetical protein C0991_011006 [Blastosporella zonata]|nr:hypothetical protein C0991_011006 [Blastosporella zonata]
MASQSIMRAGMKSPVHALMKPGSTRSILKRPAPLPLSPNPLPFAASFSVVINSSHLSPHVHFPSSPAMAATFTAYSANTYDRGPIIVSPGSAGLGAWANRPLSPSARNAFKLLDPPKRVQTPRSLTVPVFEDPRSPKPYKAAGRVVPVATQKVQLLAVPTFEDLRSPKPYKEVRKPAPAATQKVQLLAVPTLEDPRSPKPYKARSGVSFDELTLHVPRGKRGTAELGKALSTYPRSPYPSAPLEEEVPGETTMRGRIPKADKLQPPPRARSLEKQVKPRRQTIGSHVSSSLIQNFLSPVRESTPRITIAKPAPLDLESQFWQSVSLEEPESAYMTANEIPESAASPVPNIVFGSADGQLWSPRVPRKDVRRVIGADMPMLSPAQRRAFSKGMVASPSPNDPFAAFPSFSISMLTLDGAITYPPRARVEL